MSSSKQPLSPQTVPCRSPRRPGLHVDQPELDEPEEFFIKSAVGQQVIMNYQDPDTWERGRAPGYRTTPVEVVEGMSMTGDRRKCVPEKQHLPVNGAIPYPSLHVGDKVRVRQFHTETSKELFRPATVKALPPRPMSKDAFFKVSLDVDPTDLERFLDLSLTDASEEWSLHHVLDNLESITSVVDLNCFTHDTDTTCRALAPQ